MGERERTRSASTRSVDPWSVPRSDRPPAQAPSPPSERPLVDPRCDARITSHLQGRGDRQGRDRGAPAAAATSPAPIAWPHHAPEGAALRRPAGLLLGHGWRRPPTGRRAVAARPDQRRDHQRRWLLLEQGREAPQSGCWRPAGQANDQATRPAFTLSRVPAPARGPEVIAQRTAAIAISRIVA
jgi:hypothetical protein